MLMPSQSKVHSNGNWQVTVAMFHVIMISDMRDIGCSAQGSASVVAISLRIVVTTTTPRTAWSARSHARPGLVVVVVVLAVVVVVVLRVNMMA